MRIAHILTSLGIGGAEKQATAIAERMAARGHEVALIILKSSEQQEWPTTLPIYRLGMKKSLPNMISSLARGRSVLRTFKPDLVHSHTFPANMMARALRSIGAAPRVLSTIHNVYEGDRQRTLAYRLTDPLCILTTAVSHAVAERYIQIKAVPRSKLSVITNGIDTDAFCPSHHSESSLGPAPRSGESFVWLAAGRDVPAKDFDNLFTAYRKAREEFPNTELCIAGNLASHRCAAKDSPSGIRWLGLSRDMPNTVARCDAFVLSSAWEGMPLVVGEAMAMEKPVVATDVGGVRELLDETGIVVPSKNPGALAQAMLRMMRMHGNERSEMGEAARERVIQHFDINAKTDEWESLYTRILRSHG